MAKTKSELTAAKLREHTVEELRLRLDDAKAEAFKLRVRSTTKELDNPMRMRIVRRDIARIETILTEKQTAAK